jgi:serine/threonine-protein kinase HipA
MTMADLTVLDVNLHGKRVGTLTRLPGDQTLFAFDQAYIDNPNRPTLSLSFHDAAGGIIDDVKPTRTRVPPFFSNLLPEGPLHDYLAKRAGIHPGREFFLLWILGQDLPGAVTITPAGGEARLSLPENEAESSPNNSDDSPLRFSLAGVQLKFSAVMEAAGGLTIPAQGIGGSWIVKLPSMKYEGVPENEFGMMELARQIGIDIPEVRLVPLDRIEGLPADMARLSGNALAVRRFDRTDKGQTVHMEDFAQVFGLYPEKKYERASYRNIAEVLWAETGDRGIAEFIRRLVFNTLIGNADMHLKNWSLIYPDGKKAALAPGYDYLSTIAYLPDIRMALTLGRSKQMTDLSLDQLSYLAAKARLPEKLVHDAALETVERFMSIWEKWRQSKRTAQSITEPIDELLPRIPLVNER